MPQEPPLPSDPAPIHPSSWQEIEAILDQLFELPESEVVAAVEGLCGHDAQLRSQVEVLLKADREERGVLDGSVDRYAQTLLAVEGEDEGLALAEEDLSGQRFGPYEVLRLIGKGGMGVVYEAFDARLDRSVALKLLPREWSRDEAIKTRFLREARAASALDHGNICTVHDLGESDAGRLFIVMAFYDGETLKTELERGPLPLDRARNIARQVAAGLHSAHQAGIVHRDIKPANVVLTAHGDAKILDFGIAKVEGSAGLTRTGTSPGTPAYMSPEQIRGEMVDGRSDVWALGVLLYEMLSGRRPFSSDSDPNLVFKVLNDPPEKISLWLPEIPPDVTRVIDRALAKDPDRRYASCEAMAQDLERTATGMAVAAATRHGRRWPTMNRLGFGILAATVCVGSVVWWWIGGMQRADLSRQEPMAEVAMDTTVANTTVVATGGAGQRPPITKSRLAVLPFNNLSADASLDWLRHGMTQMLVTDLSQSPEIDILSGRRLRQAFKELNTDGTDALTLGQLRVLGEKFSVDAVVQGSFLRLGETLRVTFALEQVPDGTLLGGETFEGRGEEALFSLVDRMMQSIRHEYELVPVLDQVRDIQEVTTSSIEAWRYYSEAAQLAAVGKRSEAVALFEKSVELDPDFALALSNLGGVHNALGHSELARRYTERAVELSDRLPLHERFLIQAVFYSTRWSTYDQAIKIYREGLEIYPQRQSWRANLARLYAYVERYEEAVESFQQVIDAGSTHTGNYTEAANALAALNRFEDGQDLLERFARSYPDRWLIHLGLGWHATEWGRYEEAHRAFARATELRPGEFFIAYGQWRLAVLEDDWQGAEAKATEMARHDDSLAQWLAAVARSRNAIYQGRQEEALSALADAVEQSQEDSFSAQARIWRATLLLHRGDASSALQEAELAQQEGEGDWPELEGLFVAAQAAETLGDSAGADRRLQELRDHHATRPNRVEERQIYHLAGWLALARHDLEGARRGLENAADLLPARGVEFVWYVYPEHVPIWYALGRLEEAAGRPAEAREWYARCEASGSEHLERPVIYGRCRAALDPPRVASLRS